VLKKIGAHKRIDLHTNEIQFLIILVHNMYIEKKAWNLIDALSDTKKINFFYLALSVGYLLSKRSFYRPKQLGSLFLYTYEPNAVYRIGAIRCSF